MVSGTKLIFAGPIWLNRMEPEVAVYETSEQYLESQAGHGSLYTHEDGKFVPRDKPHRLGVGDHVESDGDR
jgi:hypothetical protein